MRIQIEPTDILTDLDGVPVRVWNGITENGTQCFVFVHRVAVYSEDSEEFDAELLDQPSPGVKP
jgi:hypothetical protein